MTVDASTELKKLREPFKPDQVNKIPRGNVTLDYIGHANVTERLLDVDPAWVWEPVSFEADGQPCVVRDNNGQPIGLWIRLTVLGVTRYGYGSCQPKADAVKELIGDAIRNAAMRFGVALDLWKKETVEAPSSNGAPARVHPIVTALDHECGLCGKKLQRKQGVKDGKPFDFVGCSGYPACKFTDNDVESYLQPVVDAAELEEIPF